jgi:acyl-ACP thioesterase
MNNAAYWQVSEELLSMYPEIRRNMRAIVEHVNPVDPETIVQVDIEEKSQTDVSVVLRSDSQLHATMWLGLRR